MPSVAFATYRDEPGIAEDDTLAADALRRAGVAVTPVVWDGSDADWSRFDAVVIRSVWDYFRKAGRFVQWIRGFTSCSPRLWNQPESVLWNINKRYLLDLAVRGIPVVPTEYMTAAENPDLRAVLRRRGWSEAVVKPAIAVGSHGAWRTSTSAAEVDQARLAEQLDTGDALIQSYMPEIRSKGEWSLVFLGPEFSHAVLKQPHGGDFRVQEHLGGRVMQAEPDPDLVRQARAAVAAVGQPLLYARVDGVERDGQLVLMELEIIEPSLFFGLGPGSAGRFAEAILRVLQGRTFKHGLGQ
jgi:glutathione synthase/RimK-type ligase-like ATP-grasp enzyme